MGLFDRLKGIAGAGVLLNHEILDPCSHRSLNNAVPPEVAVSDFGDERLFT